MAGETSYSCYRFRLCVRGVASVLSAAAKMDQPGDCHTGGVGTVAGAGENVDRAARVGYGGKR